MNSNVLNWKNWTGIFPVILVTIAASLLFYFYHTKTQIDDYSVQGKFLKMESLHSSQGLPQFKIYFTSDYDNKEKVGILDPGTHFFTVVKDDKGKYTRETLDLGKLQKGDTIYVSSKSDIDTNSTFNIKEIYVKK